MAYGNNNKSNEQEVMKTNWAVLSPFKVHFYYTSDNVSECAQNTKMQGSG
jgi:hypothetical protein